MQLLSKATCLLGHAELLWLPELSIRPHTSISARIFVWRHGSSALLCAGQAVFQFSVFKSKDEAVGDGGWGSGKALRALSPHQKSLILMTYISEAVLFLLCWFLPLFSVL